MKFNPNQSQIMRRWRPDAQQSTQERKETIYAILAVGSIILATVVFLWLAYVS